MTLKRFLIYGISALVSMVTYYILTNNLEISLYPHTILVGLFYNLKFEFVEGIGYRDIGGYFIIGSECLGARLLVCLFFIFIISKIRDNFKFYEIFLYLLISGVFSLILTVIRILISVPFATHSKFILIHNIISLIIYFLSSMFLYSRATLK